MNETFHGDCDLLLALACSAILAAATFIGAAGLNNAQWIWTSEQTTSGGVPTLAPSGQWRGFRLDFVTESGKTPACTTITMSADNWYTLWYNGEVIGATADDDSWEASHSYIVAATNGLNVIAVNVFNDGGPAGLIGEVIVEYTDGSFQIFWTSDLLWKTLPSPTPDNFYMPSFDDSQWVAATNYGLNGAQPWGTIPVLPMLGNGLNLSQWIWTNEEPSTSVAAPIGTRVFRKTVVPDEGRVPVCAKMLMAADNEYAVYVNGELIGQQTQVTFNNLDSWDTAFPLSAFNLNPTSNVFAVAATNTAAQAGLIGAIMMIYSNGVKEPSDFIVTDDTWKTAVYNPPITEQPSTDDSQWPNAVELGGWGVSPWGDIIVPTY
ncbi:hypothetical protein GYMLUDRAFT_57171 [Collybiopsis luxurians FD-317 M1]|uniref:Unplaced genomic scaffold GYMLUscaffold_14, whole genome shotgun sequence n=1 Tax=Collybiopsis luxurians FD-317 M1 TaxID=944289 RepID=A0A0D0CM84_9AGAR|nr:hypothetical protein GYMLUDRAFT_57171 [Collybiopsis luxurians FD-317 M1]